MARRSELFERLTNEAASLDADDIAALGDQIRSGACVIGRDDAREAILNCLRALHHAVLGDRSGDSLCPLCPHQLTAHGPDGCNLPTAAGPCRCVYGYVQLPTRFDAVHAVEVIEVRTNDGEVHIYSRDGRLIATGRHA